MYRGIIALTIGSLVLGRVMSVFWILVLILLYLDDNLLILYPEINTRCCRFLKKYVMPNIVYIFIIISLLLCAEDILGCTKCTNWEVL